MRCGLSTPSAATVFVLTPAELAGILADHAKAQRKAAAIELILAQTALKDFWLTTFYPNSEHVLVVPIALAASDLTHLGKALAALGWGNLATRIEVKRIAGSDNILLKGDPGARRFLQGTRYLATNPKIVHLGIGMLGAQHVVRSGLALAIVTTVGIEVVDYILRDDATMASLFAGAGVEVAKAVVVTGLSLKLVALGSAAGIGAFAVAPLAATIVVAFAIGYGVNKLDDRLHVKQGIKQFLRDLATQPSDPHVAVGYYPRFNRRGTPAVLPASRSAAGWTTTSCFPWASVR